MSSQSLEMSTNDYVSCRSFEDFVNLHKIPVVCNCTLFPGPFRFPVFVNLGTRLWHLLEAELTAEYNYFIAETFFIEHFKIRHFDRNS